MGQFNAKVGETIRIGSLETRILGSLQRVPGETVVFATLAPRVYIAMQDLEKTGLLREGSLAGYRVAFRLPATTNAAQIVKGLQLQLDQNRLAWSTVEKRKEDLGRSMENLEHYLNLVGFIALLLGAVGVASAIHVHIKQKLDTIAVLRCLGCSIGQTFAIYLGQAILLGLVGASVGTALGVLIQMSIPAVMADFMPFQMSFAVSWPAAAEGLGLGFAICLLFALLPLLSVRRVSPLAAIRSSYEPPARRKRDPLSWLAYSLVIAGVVAFSLTHTQKWQHGIGFALGLAIAFGLLAGVAQLLIRIFRRLPVGSLPYVVRQGFANLHRPNNRTVLLMLAIGLGTFLILTAYLTKEALLGQLSASQQTNRANTVLFDIQPDQRTGVIDLLRAHHFPILDQAPIVTMRLQSVRGRTVEELLADKTATIPRWVLRREFRSTYNRRLRDGERLLTGQWQESVTNGTPLVPVSLEQGIAKDLAVTLGDELVFDVQGLPIHCRVASLREVDWKRIQPNFFVVFPSGVLEEAPNFFVVVTRIDSADASAELQRTVVQSFPTVAVVDLRLVVQTVESLLTKVSLVVRFMALFIVFTGLIVLAGAILTGRYQRIRESILLRTLGASRRQILQILLSEYLCLGTLAATTGVGLSLPASWSLAHFVLQAPWQLPLLPLVLTVSVVSLITVVIGLLSSRGVANHPPLSILRAE